MPKCRPFAHANAIGDTELIPRTFGVQNLLPYILGTASVPHVLLEPGSRRTDFAH